MEQYEILKMVSEGELSVDDAEPLLKNANISAVANVVNIDSWFTAGAFAARTLITEGRK
ncbi:MAG TPA: hypothetical protein O0X32_03770 [Methanocorpusculum sp.]|nr:hypothetical protein [Methanocorpusculum sp.]